MNVPLIDAATVRRTLTMPDCIDLIARTQAAISRGEIRLPLRSAVPLQGRNSLLLMPGATTETFGAKLLSLYPDNPVAGLPVIQGCVLLFDPATGAPAALVEAASITALRTAAASGAATRALAREDASTLALLGYGVQAGTHLDAMCAIRPVTEVRVWGPDLKKASAFAARASRDRDIQITAHATPTEAITNADLICAVTAATDPIIEASAICPGAHLNLVGAHTPRTREADSDTIAMSRVFTEVTEFALEEAGDLLLAIDEGKFSADDIVGEIGAVISGDIEGRRHADETTLYKNLGNTAQDLAAAHHVFSVVASTR